jgi:hypothetical protein
MRLPAALTSLGRPDMAREAVHGAIAGIGAAATMSVLRHAARRAGLIDKEVPQVVEEWAARRIGVAMPGGSTGHHVADRLLHLGHGAFWGAVYGMVMGGRRGGMLHGAGFGVLLWAFGFALLIPLLGAHRPAWRESAAENAVNILSHLLYGAAVGLIDRDVSEQQDHRALPGPLRRAQRIG